MININLLSHIKERGITQRKLAKVSNINEGILSEIINGRRNPTIEQRRLIANALNVPQKEIFLEGIHV